MSTAASTPFAPGSRAIASGRLWYGIAAPTAAWAAHGLSGFLIANGTCSDGTASWGALPAGGVRALLLVLTAAFLAVAISGALVSWRTWRGLAAGDPAERPPGEGRAEYMAVAGVLVGIVFSLGILLGGLPMIALGVCVQTR